jgi:uncharacterized protein (DUF4415 family)
MSVNKRSSTWVDPDDAAEVTPTDMARASRHIDGQVVSAEQWRAAQTKRPRGRPTATVPRPMLSMRVDADVLSALRATGPGWQTRVHALLREAVEQGRLR